MSTPPLSTPPLSTDEPVDRLFSRPVASVIVKLLAPTPITPNGVTGMAVLCGMGAGFAMILGDGPWAAAGIAGFLAFDCADGQLARLRGAGGYLGRAMDGAGDYTASLSMLAGLIVWILKGGTSIPLTALLTLATAVSMGRSSFLLDRYKRRYRGDMDDVAAVEREAAATSGLKAYLIRSLIPYARRLDGGVVVPDLPAYQARVRLPMRLWLLVGPTSHLTVLAVCVALGRPTLACLLIIFPMNVLSLSALVCQVRAERRVPAVVRRLSATAA